MEESCSPMVMKSTINGSKQPILAPTGPAYLNYTSFPRKATIKNSSSSFFPFIIPEEPDQVVDDSEISIFEAEKYFNENNVNDPKPTKGVSPVNPINPQTISEITRFSSASSSVDGYRSYGTKNYNATPTASSEASWNSQTGLLSNPPGSIAVSMQQNPDINHDKRRKGSSVKWAFVQKCSSCLGTKSTQVEENLSEPNGQTPALRTKAEKQIEAAVLKTEEKREMEMEMEINPQIQRISAESRFNSGLGGHQRIIASGRALNNNRGSGFTFPITSREKLVLNGVTRSHNSALVPDLSRESLEVFRYKDVQHPVNESEKTARRSFTFTASPKSRINATDDDAASDASSDLFELESFSTQTTSYPTITRPESLDNDSSFNSRTRFLQYRRNLDEEPPTPSIAPSELYEPSEVSIDWSVTTAEGFDRSSTVTNLSANASEAEYSPWRIRNGSYGAGNGGGESKKKSNGLLGCHCEKAVSIGPNAVKSGSGDGLQGGPSFFKSGRVECLKDGHSIRAHNEKGAPLAIYRVSLPFAT